MNSQVILFIVVGLLVIAGVIYGAIAAHKRQDALIALSRRLGLRLRAAEDYSLPDRYEFLDALAKGESRYASNILSGTYRDYEVLAFDYHYETHSSDGKGHRTTHHHYFSFFILQLPVLFPELKITGESLFSKIAQAFGYADIDFESAEFSRAFCVRSNDKKFAYDVCNPQMMEYLLANRDLSLEIEQSALALAFGSRLSADQIEHNLNRLIEIRLRLPQYLFAPLSR
jgi:hypothetical protein